MGKIVTYVAGAAGMPTAAEFESIKAAGWWAKGDGADVEAWASRMGDGGIHRFGVITKMENELSSFGVLDTKDDWRHRVILVGYALGIPVQGNGFDSGFDSGFGGGEEIALSPLWPGAHELLSFVDSTGLQAFYTGAGHGGAVGSGSKPDYALQLSPGLYLYAQEDSGELVVESDTNLSWEAVGLVLAVHAHDRLTGESDRDDPSPTSSTVIEPAELNTLQDGMLLEQFDAWDVERGTPPDSMPLGPKGSGADPLVPAEWPLKRRDGRTDLATQIVRRQRLAGGERRRQFGVDVGGAHTEILDATFDWRDRFIYGAGRFDIVDIRPGHASDTGHNAADAWSGSAYTWTGVDSTAAPTEDRHAIQLATDLYIMVDEDNGNLVIRNDTGSLRFVTGLVFTSPALGPRTVRTQP